MELSIFLAKVLGWYLVITGLFLVSRQALVRSILKDILAERALLFFLGVITLVMGLLMVVSHNIWVMAWPVIITVLAWMTLVSGILRMCFPALIVDSGKKMLKHQHTLAVLGVLSVVIGLYLLFKSYSLLLMIH